MVTGCTTQADFEALSVEVIAAKAAADRDPADGDHRTRRDPAEQGHRGGGAVLEPPAEPAQVGEARGMARAGRAAGAGAHL